MTYDEIKKTAKAHMQKGVDHAKHEFATLHTGKATPSMVESVQVHVESYGTTSHLRDIAAVTTPDSRTIQIQPWDRGTLKDIEKAILSANLGLTPSIQGALVRVPVPELSGDRRKELVKVAHKMAEEGRVSVRHARQEAMTELKKTQKDGDISEDDLHRYEKEIQEMTDEHVGQINSSLEAKEKDLTEVK